MICPHCQTENPNNARYCANCGLSLTLRCSNCRAELPSGVRFCMQCGQAIRQQTPDDEARHTRLAAAAPGPLVDKVRTSPLAGERRTVTVLFADVVGSTLLADQVDVESWTAIMNGAFERITPAVYRYEGTIARLLGDSLLAFFGAPVAHEDDPLRAVHASLDALEAIREYAQQVERRYGFVFKMRFCLNTGPVVIGPVGSDLKYEYTAMGGAVNLAALLKFSDHPMAVLVTENSQRFVAPFFDLAEMEAIEVKGRKAPLKAFQVLNPKAVPGSLRGFVGLGSPMVGRDAELASLIHLCDTVRSGLGRAVLISGDPGLGKSRLIAEWQTAIARLPALPPPQWAEGRCLSYGQGMAHHLVLDLLRSLIGVSGLASETETRSALRMLVSDLFSESPLGMADEVYSYLGHLLLLDLEQETLKRVQLLDPQALQAQYVAAIKKLLQALAARRPIILILEDLHWVDPSSAELISSLLPVVLSAPVLVCLVTRPERDTPGSRLVNTAREVLGSSLTELPLKSLSADESRQLIANLLAIEALPESLRTLILQKSEGNPFFVEEVVRTLIERGAIVQRGSGWAAGPNLDNLDIPDNLQGLLMARIDRLTEQGKNTLKVASVVGRHFPVRVLNEVMGITGQPGQSVIESTISTLSSLESAGLIQVAQVQPDLEYFFRHSLVQEAAYASILVADRRRLHQAVGETVEQMFPDQLCSCELAPLLAQHFSEAGDDQRALKYFSIAGEAALDCFANQEAENHFRRGVSLSDSSESCVRLLGGLGEALSRQSRYTEAITTWREAIDLALPRGDLDQVARLFALSARAAWWSGDTPLSLALCKEGMQLVEGASESSDQAYLIHETARAYYFNGVPGPAKQLCLQALEMAERHGNIEVQADALTTLGILSDLSPQESVDALKKAITLAEQAGLLITASRAHINMGSMVKGFFGDLEGARFHYQRALDIAQVRGVVQEEIFALQSLVSISLETGDMDQVEETLPVLEKLMGELSDPSGAITEYNVIKAVISLWQGKWEEALEMMRINVIEARRDGDLQNLLNTDLNMVITLLEMNDFGYQVDWVELESTLDEALQLCDRGLGDRVTPLCYFALLRLRQGRLPDAEAYFSQTATEIGERSIIWIEILMNWTKAEIAVAKEDWLAANQSYEQAYQVVNRLNQRWFKGRISLGWAEMLIAQGDPAGLERARVLLREASAAFATLKATGYLERIEKRNMQLRERNLAQAAIQHEVVQEMAQARRVQKSFFPEASPQIAGWDLAAVLEPARETSGDFFDFIPLPGERLGIVIADVADKGAGAALYMASSLTLIRTYAAEFSDHPAQVLAAANQRLILDTHSGLFVTLFFAVIDPASGHMAYCNAGHNPPLLFNPAQNQDVRSLTGTGMPLGVMKDATWKEDELTLAQGEVLILFTDGVTEAQNPAGEFFGETQVRVSIMDCIASSLDGGCSAQSILDKLLKHIHQFIGSAPRSDDITLMVVRRALV